MSDIESIKVTVVIPTFNRYLYLLKAIESVLNQTHENLELIIVDDCSSQTEYLTLLDSKIAEYQQGQSKKQIRKIRLHQNTKQTFGFACTAHVRNIGILSRDKQSKYVAFLDDDDQWYSNKVIKQLQALQNQPGVLMSSTDGHATDSKTVSVYNGEMCKSVVERVFGVSIDCTPTIWKLEDILKHNLIITSSVMVSAELLVKVKGFADIPNPCAEDYDCWKRCLQHTNLVYVNEPLFLYDLNHGAGRNW